MRTFHQWATVFVVLGLIGCGSDESPPLSDTIPEDMLSATPPRNNVPPEPPPGNAVGIASEILAPTKQAADVDTSSENNPPGDGSAANEPAETERVVAEVGVGKQGRSLDDVEGVIVTPAKTLFTAREKVVFDIQIPQALNLYKATNGRGPQSHDEFMQQVVTANQIKLPELPAGQKYVYDPQAEQLMVERPR